MLVRDLPLVGLVASDVRSYVAYRCVHLPEGTIQLEEGSSKMLQNVSTMYQKKGIMSHQSIILRCTQQAVRQTASILDPHTQRSGCVKSEQLLGWTLARAEA
jgi:hypothetical protein